MVRRLVRTRGARLQLRRQAYLLLTRTASIATTICGLQNDGYSTWAARAAVDWAIDNYFSGPIIN